MPILDTTDAQAVSRYQAFVRHSAFATATQDLNWSQVKKGWDAAQFFIEKDGKITAALSLVIKRMAGFSMLYAPRGPVCDPLDGESIEALIRELSAYAKKQRAFVLRFDPEINYDLAVCEAFEKRGFVVRSRGVDKNALIQPRYNMILNLKDETEESLLKRFSQKTRYNISLSSRKGVTIRQGDTLSDLKVFYELYKVMSIRNRLVIRNFEYFEDMLKAFKGQIRVYIASHEGDDLSAAIGILYGDKLWYIYGASSNEKRNLMPNYLMQWEMIRWGLSAGAMRYDFGGVFELDKEDGLYKFKEGFCREEGVTELIGEIDKVYKPMIYKLFTDVYPAMQRLKIKLFRNG